MLGILKGEAFIRSVVRFINLVGILNHVGVLGIFFGFDTIYVKNNKLGMDKIRNHNYFWFFYCVLQLILKVEAFIRVRVSKVS